MPGNDKLITLVNLGTFRDNVEEVIDAKIQESSSMIADAYDPTSTYDVGDYAIYEDVLYRCTTAITVAEAWNASHWALVDVGEELKTKQNVLSMATNADITRMFATEYRVSASATHGTISGDSTIWSDESKAFTITPDVDYALPDSITVIGASYTYDPAAGIIVLSNAVRDVVIEVNCRVATALSNFTYTQNTSAKTLSITGPNSDCPNDVAIAPVYAIGGEEYTVTSIGNNAFKNFTDLTSILLPQSLASIGSRAFEDCSQLSAMFIPPNITSVPESAFRNCYNLRSVNIPDSINSIGQNAFYECRSMTSVSIPDTVTFIDSCAFQNCNQLASIELPSSLTSIESETFYGCSSLTSISLPDSLLTIGYEAFSRCIDLTSLNLPEHLESISSYAFKGCSSLSSIYISSSVSSIGDYAFSECPAVTSIVVSSENNTFDSRDNCNAIIKTSNNELIAGCSTTIIPNTVTSIGIGAFHSCYRLESIVIPAEITSIGDSAFCGCSHLIIYCEAESKPEGWHYSWNSGSRPVVWGYQFAVESNDILYGLGEIAGDRYAIVVGSNSDEIEQMTFSSEINGYPVTKIGSNAFYNYDHLVSLSIPSSVTSIESYAFQHCIRLKSVIIPSSVTYIGSNAFSDYSSSYTTIYCEVGGKPEGWADNWTRADNEVIFGYQTTVESNGVNYALCERSNSRYAVVDSCDESATQAIIQSEINGYTVTRIRNHAFFNYDISLESVSIPNSITSIGAYAFYNSRLASIDIPSSVTSIGYKAFAGCSHLRSANIPASATSIGNNVFADCDWLDSVTIADGVTSISDYAFSNCDSLSSINVPSSVTFIGDYAFYRCSDLTSIVIPDSVATIEYGAFLGCTGLTIYCEANSQPEGWNSGWNLSDRPVVWGYTPQ